MNQDRIAEPNPWELRDDEYDRPSRGLRFILSDAERRRWIEEWNDLQKGGRLEVTEL
jgi:hypothetical protein